MSQGVAVCNCLPKTAWPPTSISISSTFTHFTPSGITQGLNIYQRVGRAITLTGVEIQGVFSSSDTFNVVRILVHNRYGGYSATPKVTYGNTFDNGRENAAEKQKFYLDRLVGFPCQSDAGAAVSYPTIPMSVFIPMKLDVRYDNAGVITDNCLYISMISDSAVAAHPDFRGFIRLHFKDS